jgi:hypothetical protein
MLSESRSYAIAALFVIAIFLSPRTSYGQTVCPGPLKEPHLMGTFNFETNSRLDPSTLPGFKSGIVSCVGNLDTKYPLYVHWLIPGPHGWAPAGQKLESVARLIKDDRVAPMKGCLQYGNQGSFAYGQFLGNDTDQPRVIDEDKRGCRTAAAQPPGPSESVLGNLLLRFKNFFPSDMSRPQETMLQMEGTVGVEVRGTDSYQSIVRYTMSRYPGSEGNVSEIAFRPAFRGAAVALIPAFNRKNDGGAVRGAGDGQITFDVQEVRNPQLVYASYNVLDREGRVVASIDFPVFVPRQ